MNEAELAPENVESTPEDLDQLRQVVADNACVLPVGNRTKPPLSRCDGASLVSLRLLRGVIEYEPSEFTFTAWAGTPISEIQQALEEKQQYLPFDPMLVKAGATIGGTIAAGLSGPGRFRYGGVRDFFLGVQLLSPDGQLVRGGGKVVKNAAGFDLPKFLVGSLGRYGLMVEVSFKVFPKPPATCTLRLHPGSHQEAIQWISAVACSRWEADAVDYRPADRSLYVRLAGPSGAIDRLAEEIQSKWSQGEVLNMTEADEFWQRTRELAWFDVEQSDVKQSVVAKVPTTATSFLSLQRLLEERDDDSVHLSVAGGVAWVMLSGPQQVAWLSDQLTSLGLAGLVIRGDVSSPYIGLWQASKMQQAVKHAMDPFGKFPGV